MRVTRDLRVQTTSFLRLQDLNRKGRCLPHFARSFGAYTHFQALVNSTMRMFTLKMPRAHFKHFCISNKNFL